MMITHYLKVAFRNLWKYKTQHLIALAGVGVALLCFSICLYLVRYVHDINHCFENYNRIAELSLYDEEEEALMATPVTLAEELRIKKQDEIEALCVVDHSYMERPFNVEVRDGKQLPYTFNVAETDSSFFQVLTPQILCGSAEVAKMMPNSLVVSESMARRVYGDIRQAIGKQLVMTRRLSTSPDSTPRTGSIVYTIQAVIADISENNSISFLNSLDMFSINDSEGIIQSDACYSIIGSYTYALLREGVTPEQLDERFRKVKQTHHYFVTDYVVRAYPMGAAFVERGDLRVMAWITMAAGVLILLVALLNFFHLLIGSFLTRMREFSIRRVAGATASGVFLQLFVHSALLILLAGLLTFVCIEVLTPWLQMEMAGISLQIDSSLLMRQTFDYLLGLLGVGALICWFVGWKVRHTSVHAGVTGGIHRRGKKRLRNLLLGVQLFICWVFISLAAALYLQSDKTGRTLFGTLSLEEKEQILSIPMDFSFMNAVQKQDLIHQFKNLSGVEEVLPADINYLGGVSGTGMYTEKDNKGSYVDVNVMRITSGFFRFMHIPMRSGHTLRESSDLVIDEALSHRLGTDIMGKPLYNFDGDAYTVKGVCQTFVSSVYYDSEGFIFLLSGFDDYCGHCYVKCKEGQAETVSQEVRKILKKTLPESVEVKVSTFMDDIRESQVLEFKLRGIVLFFSVVVLVISLLGVYSAVTIDTEYRRKEMAIRKINGAGMRQIVWLFARLYVTLLTVTAVLGFALVEFLLRQFSTLYTVFFQHGVAFYFCLFLSVSLFVALTVAFRIWQVSRVNPAEEIKRE